MHILIPASFLLGILIIVKGGDYFVDAASYIAEASGLPKLLIGATVVSLATALPEVLVSLSAAVSGKTDMAVGNAIGSVTANTGLIMAISTVLMPMTARRSEILPKSLLMAAACLALLFISGSGSLTLPSSLVLLSVFLIFTADSLAEAKAAGGSSRKVKSKNIFPNILKLAGGAAGIILGAELLVEKGSAIARLAGVPESVIALTAIAAGTSLPELAAALSAAVKGEISLSVGNIIGANIIDLTLILPLCALVSGKALPISPLMFSRDIPFCLFLIILMTLPVIVKGRFGRWQGFLALSSYVVYALSVLR